MPFRTCFDKFFHILFIDTADSNHNSNNNPHHNPGGNPHGNPHNNSNSSGPVTLYDLRHGTKNALGVSEHSVRCLLNVENWTAWRLKVISLFDH